MLKDTAWHYRHAGASRLSSLTRDPLVRFRKHDSNLKELCATGRRGQWVVQYLAGEVVSISEQLCRSHKCSCPVAAFWS